MYNMHLMGGTYVEVADISVHCVVVGVRSMGQRIWAKARPVARWSPGLRGDV